MTLGAGGEITFLRKVNAAEEAAREAWQARSGEPLSGEVAEQALVALARARDLVDLCFSMASSDLEASRLHHQVDDTPILWIRQSCKMASGAAGDRLAVGENESVLSASVEAVAEGEIGFAHLALVARTYEGLACAEARERFDEERLLHQARNLNLTRFRTYCRHYRHSLDAAALARQEADQIENRFLRITTGQDGSVWLRGCLDPAGGAALRSALEPLARRRPEEKRAKERRLADALVEASELLLGSGTLPRQGGVRPHLNLTTSLETLMGVRGSAGGRLEYSDPISEKAVERISCDCTVTRIVFDPEGRVVDVGRAKRVVTPAQRKALVARDGGCVWPGCDRPASLTSVHHLVHWARGGTTDLENEALVCGRHHWKFHEGGWTLVRFEDGGLLPVPPSDFDFEDPWEVAPPPEEGPPAWIHELYQQQEQNVTAELAWTG